LSYQEDGAAACKHRAECGEPLHVETCAYNVDGRLKQGRIVLKLLRPPPLPLPGVALKNQRDESRADGGGISKDKGPQGRAQDRGNSRKRQHGTASRSNAGCSELDARPLPGLQDRGHDSGHSGRLLNTCGCVWPPTTGRGEPREVVPEASVSGNDPREWMGGLHTMEQGKADKRKPAAQLNR
jgi:hypothetical protein